jgi:hypothetical protein
MLPKQIEKDLSRYSNVIEGKAVPKAHKPRPVNLEPTKKRKSKKGKTDLPSHDRLNIILKAYGIKHEIYPHPVYRPTKQTHWCVKPPSEE